ncbi:hypothetical protein AB0P19_11025 [Microbacterium oleivorans]|uniref:hypothetical protein n=1 Tax=Microbacterium oleivorans TaxID=273677 RepID=UPI0033FD8597
MFVAATRVPIAQFGVLAALYAGALILSDLSDFGTGLRLVLRSGRLSVNALDARVRGLLAGRIVLHLPLLALAILGGFIWSGWESVAATVLLSASIAVRVLLQARERALRLYSMSSLLMVMERGVALGLLILFPSTSVAGALLCLAGGSVVASAFVLFRVKYERRSVSAWTQHRQAVPVGISSASSSLSQLEVPIVTAAAGAFAGGEYAVAARLLSPVTFIPASLSSVLARELPTMPRERANRTLYLLLTVSCGGVAIMAGVLVFLAPWIAQVLGPDYSGTIIPIRVFAVLCVVVAARQTFQVALQSRGEVAYVAKSALAGTAAYLVLLAIGSVVGGAIGAAGGAILGQVGLLSVLVLRWTSNRG